MTNEKRVRSFSATKEIDEILDNIAWGQRSKLICKAIDQYVKNGARDEGPTQSMTSPESSETGSETSTPSPEPSTNSTEPSKPSKEPEATAAKPTEKSYKKPATRNLLKSLLERGEP